MSMLRPMADRILVLMDPEAEEVRGVIVSAGKPPPQNQGRVVAVGPRVHESILVGSRILWSRWGGQDVEVDGVVHKVLRTEDKPGEIGEVLAVLT